MVDPEFKHQLTKLRRVAVVISLGAMTASLSTGCAYNRSAVAVYEQTSQQPIKPVAGSQWLPIHVKNDILVGIGAYSLPQGIALPAGLNPKPEGLAYISPTRSDVVTVRVFFELTDEKAVLDWAKIGEPLSPASDSGYWYSKYGMYLIHAKGRRPNGTAAPEYKWSFGYPTEAPLSWKVLGVFHTKHWGYSVTWSMMPTVRAGDEKNFPAGRLPYPEDAVQIFGDDTGSFGPSSPVASQKKLVSLSVSYGREPQVQWLPIRFSNHQIIAVGNHALHCPVDIPINLRPVPQAQAYFRNDTVQDLSGIVIYFPSAEEKAVMKWAQSYPLVVNASPGASWANKTTLYETAQENLVGNYLVPCTPNSPTLSAWHIGGTLNTDTITYGIGWSGLSVVTPAELKNNPKAQILLNGHAADYIGPGSDFEPNSPLSQEKRHVKLSLIF